MLKFKGQIIYLKGGGFPKPIIIGNIYRPPRMLRDQIKQFINEFTSLILSLEKCNRSINIAGDYNLNLLEINENGMCSEFFDLLTSYSLFLQITLPTTYMLSLLHSPGDSWKSTKSPDLLERRTNLLDFQ